ncbi:MAG TPA: ABC transporter substrate-binding protein [Acidimicrobiales bacterium]|nr:ABC transporter substrate-binding protein [Acidimicrobiales bacterium]
MRTPRTALASIAALCLIGTTAATASASAKAHTAKARLGTVVVGDEGFTESAILQNIYGDLLGKLGYTVKYQTTTSRQQAIPALEKGTINVEPDYAGSLLLYLNANQTKAAGQLTSAIAADNAALKAKKAVVLPGTAGLDQNVFVVTKATSSRYGLKTLSQLKSHAKSWTFGAPAECTQNYFCAPGLKAVYGIKFKTVKNYDESGPLTVAALKSGAAEVVELFSTDPIINQDGFVSLKDDKNLEPADHLVAVVGSKFNTSAVDRALESVNARLTTNELVTLDGQASSASKPSAATIAKNFLTAAKML